FDIQQIRDDAVFRLGEGQVQLELLGGVGVGCGQRELPARSVEAGDVERGVQRAVGEVDATGDREFGFEAEHVRTEADHGRFELVQIDGYRQFGNREAARFRRRQALVGYRPPHDLDALGGKRVDLQALAEDQGGAAPDDRCVHDAQPHAFVVGDSYQ